MSTALYPILLNAARLAGLLVVLAVTDEADLTAVAASYAVSSVLLAGGVAW